MVGIFRDKDYTMFAVDGELQKKRLVHMINNQMNPCMFCHNIENTENVTESLTSNCKWDIFLDYMDFSNPDISDMFCPHCMSDYVKQLVTRINTFEFTEYANEFDEVVDAFDKAIDTSEIQPVNYILSMENNEVVLHKADCVEHNDNVVELGFFNSLRQVQKHITEITGEVAKMCPRCFEVGNSIE